MTPQAIISISKLLGNYNLLIRSAIVQIIISISKLLGNYNDLDTIVLHGMIISISKLLGNYNLGTTKTPIFKLYQYLNC